MTSTETKARTAVAETTTEKIDALKKIAVRKSSRSLASSTDSADESLISNGSRASPEFLESTESHYLWGCELTRRNDTHVVPFPSESDPDESHTLVIKSAALGVDAEENDRNVVELRYSDRDEKEARAVLTSLTLGVSDFCRLDLRTSWMSGRDITLKLVKGSGPVSILGNHVVESFAAVPDDDYEPGDSAADASSEASGMETEGDDVDADEVRDITKDAGGV